MNREYKIALSQEYYSDIVYLSQYDSDYDLVFSVLDKYSKATQIDGYTAKFQGTRTDGLGFIFEGTASDDRVAFRINTSLTAISGTHKGEIVFYDDNGLFYGSANVQIVVEPAARPDGTIDADVERAEEIAEQIQQIVDTAAEQTTAEAERIVSNLEADVSELKSGFNDLYNTAYVTDSASGGVAHFVDGADDVPLKSLKVAIEPVQSGSGDPSPSNVRPISGWNTVNVTRAGKNLLVYPYSTDDSRTQNGITFEVHKTSDGRVDYVSASGTATGMAYFNFNTWGDKRTNAKSLVGKTLKLTGCPKLGNDNKVVLMFQYRRFGSQQNIGLANDFGEGSNEFSVPSDMDSWAIYIQIAKGAQVDDARFYPMLRLASDTDDYEAYNGKDYNISLSNAGTVYGGMLDAVGGELTVDRKSVLVDGTQDIRASQVQRFFVSIANAREITTENQGTDASVISERFKSYTWSGLAQATGCAPVYGFGIAFRDPAITTISAWKEFFQNNPTRFVYMLANPITYNLTPAEVKSLLGINNIWSDAGDVDVEYRADTKLYIDKRLAEVTA